ncbi:MAG: hypothetical protein HONBIEJF_02789 [Fimbriimonadaceae bacterium]|nr:hypothetical protein [Fimbriimonadaceae bacterium]
MGGIKGSGVMKSETRSVKPFTEVVAGGNFDITIEVGKPEKVVITTDDNVLPLVTTEIEGETLKLDMPDRTELSAPVKVDISVPKLNGFVLAGAGTTVIRGIDNEKLTLSINGSGSIAVAGTAKNADFSISGSGEIEASRLKLGNAQTAITGSGEISAAPTGDLEASITGSGKVSLSAKPKSLKENIVGSGSIVQLER